MREYHDSYEDDPVEEDNECFSKQTSPVVIEQLPLRFWQWLLGQRGIVGAEARKLEEKFEACGLKCVVLPPGCWAVGSEE